ncbi:probable UDP-N-acetylglucosamine--peptide N-acetylglucosaminyltransferase SEC isoform X2 [Humulus lupulus]|uniref:probable UDP-N-acetylglucosamine--peptide N-acetylglucosaminyltransferase SEC isoform X2 n=1 Tax=Humulus lupulus TaxID=3486 RepID=UPI002B409B20|nr:probable UDP-N-acetylglucosamine--peptide N-acetylglucosaminyltransferase SEC isoform X2 [Humulus lupulus]
MVKTVLHELVKLRGAAIKGHLSMVPIDMKPQPIILAYIDLNLECVCDWDDHENKFIEVEGILRRQIKMSLIPSVQPFHAIAYPIDPMLALEISRKYAAHCSVIASRFSLPSFNYPAALPIKSEGGSKRLRAG